MARTAAQLAGLALLSSEDSLRAAVCEAIRCEAVTVFISPSWQTSKTCFHFILIQNILS